MQVAPTNNRYCGWRESVKVVQQVKTSTSSISELLMRLMTAHEVYAQDMPELLDGLSSCLSTIQSARVLLDSVAEYFKESS